MCIFHIKTIKSLSHTPRNSTQTWKHFSNKVKIHTAGNIQTIPLCKKTWFPNTCSTQCCIKMNVILLTRTDFHTSMLKTAQPRESKTSIMLRSRKFIYTNIHSEHESFHTYKFLKIQFNPLNTFSFHTLICNFHNASYSKIAVPPCQLLDNPQINQT